MTDKLEMLRAFVFSEVADYKIDKSSGKEIVRILDEVINDKFKNEIKTTKQNDMSGEKLSKDDILKKHNLLVDLVHIDTFRNPTMCERVYKAMEEYANQPKEEKQSESEVQLGEICNTCQEGYRLQGTELECACEKPQEQRVDEVAMSILDKRVKGVLVRDYSKEDLKHNTVYLQTALDCIEEALKLNTQPDQLREAAERVVMYRKQGEEDNMYSAINELEKTLNKTT